MRPVRTGPEPASHGSSRTLLSRGSARPPAAGRRRGPAARHRRTSVSDWWKAYQSDALNAFVDEGLANSPSLAAAQHTLKAAREGLRSEIGDSLYPHVDVGFSPTRERALGIPILPQAGGLSSRMCSPRKYRHRTRSISSARPCSVTARSREQVQQQAFQLESTRRALATNIVVATINAASLQAQVEATEQLVALGEQRARQTAARYQLGSASRDDMLSAEQDAANAAATLPGLRAQALAVRHAQAVLLGRTPDQAPRAAAARRAACTR